MPVCRDRAVKNPAFSLEIPDSDFDGNTQLDEQDFLFFFSEMPG
jgi:hypothetical protein